VTPFHQGISPFFRGETLVLDPHAFINKKNWELNGRIDTAKKKGEGMDIQGGEGKRKI